jgi:hypothetical protein
LNIEPSEHAFEKIKLRNVNIDNIRETISEPMLLFEDIESAARVALRKFADKHLVVIYTADESVARIITAYNSSDVDRLIRKKVERKAWIKIESDAH